MLSLCTIPFGGVTYSLGGVRLIESIERSSSVSTAVSLVPDYLIISQLFSIESKFSFKLIYKY
jgi:hypothetical protein